MKVFSDNASLDKDAKDCSGFNKDQRRNFWLRTTGAMYEMSYNSLYYYRLLEENSLRVSKFTTQIDRDLRRTFPEDPYFNKPESFDILKNILMAYSFRNPNIGYCQGMNFLAGRFLTLGFSEVEAFWLMVQLIERYLPFEYFSTMTGVLIDQKIFDFLLRTRLSKIANLFDSLDINSSLITVQWFTCIFANTFSPKVVARLWDEYFIHGHSIVYKIALGIFWISEADILEKSELSQICAAIDKNCKSIQYIEDFIKIINNKHFKNHPFLAQRINQLASNEVNKEINDRFSVILSHEEIMQKIENCEKEDYCRQINIATSNFFTFMADGVVEVVEGYWDRPGTEKVLDLSLIRESANLMVGKKNHFCQIEIDEDKVYKDEISSSFAEIMMEVKSMKKVD